MWKIYSVDKIDKGFSNKRRVSSIYYQQQRFILCIDCKGSRSSKSRTITI